MPFARVMFNKEKVSEDELLKLKRLLPRIIANRLSVQDRSVLTPDDIEVEFSSFGPFDIYHKDVQIIIWANQYPESSANSDARCRALTDDLLFAMRSGPGSNVYWTNLFVWILLQQGAFSESS